MWCGNVTLFQMLHRCLLIARLTVHKPRCLQASLAMFNSNVSSTTSFSNAKLHEAVLGSSSRPETLAPLSRHEFDL